MLSAGGMLARQLPSTVEPASGTIWTLVPDTLDVGSLRSFTARIDWAGQQEQIHDAQIATMSEHLSRPDAWLVVEDRYLTAPNFVRAVPHHFFADSEVYYYLADESSIETIELVLRHGSPWPSLGFLGSGGLPPDLDQTARVPPETLSDLAAAAEVVIVGVFDEESYLFWTLVDEPARPAPS